MSTTGVGSSRPSRTARTLPTCSTRYRVLSSPGRTAMATGCSTWATRTSRTLAARNWAEVAVRAATAVVEGARADVDGAAVVEGAPVDGPAWESGSFPEQAAAARARTRRAAEPRASRRMAAIVVGRGQLRSPAPGGWAVSGGGWGPGASRRRPVFVVGRGQFRRPARGGGGVRGGGGGGRRPCGSGGAGR